MIVVPIRKTQAPTAAPAQAPPDPTFTLMAAAMMHQQGRLVTPPKDQPVAQPS